MRVRCLTHNVIADLGDRSRSVTLPGITYGDRRSIGGPGCALLLDTRPQPGLIEVRDQEGNPAGVICNIVEEG